MSTKPYAKAKWSTITLFVIAAGLVGATCFAFDGNGRIIIEPGHEMGRKSGGIVPTVMDERNNGVRNSDPYSFNPCDLEVVGGEGCGGRGSSISGSGGILRGGKGLINGYDITSYATDPNHEKAIASILASMPQIKDKFDADAYIRAHRPKSPITGGMVERAANKFGGDMRVMLALMQQDSNFGTEGLGARTNNPGNIANYDDGSSFTYPTWEKGVEGVARWLLKHKIAASI